MSETLTRGLVETHLMSFADVYSEVQRDGVTRWAWALSEAAVGTHPLPENRECSFEFASREAAIKYAFGWIRRNRPELEKAAVQEAKDGIRYRAKKE